MTYQAVRKILLEDPNLSKEIRLDDGRTFRVRNVEEWAAVPATLVVVSGKAHTSFPHRKIASIRVLHANGSRRKS